MSASSSFDQPEQEVTSSQTMGIQPLRLLLVPALVIALLSKVIDGKGAFLCTNKCPVVSNLTSPKFCRATATYSLELSVAAMQY